MTQQCKNQDSTLSMIKKEKEKKNDHKRMNLFVFLFTFYIFVHIVRGWGVGSWGPRLLSDG